MKKKPYSKPWYSERLHCHDLGRLTSHGVGTSSRIILASFPKDSPRAYRWVYRGYKYTDVFDEMMTRGTSLHPQLLEKLGFRRICSLDGLREAINSDSIAVAYASGHHLSPDYVVIDIFDSLCRDKVSVSYPESFQKNLDRKKQASGLIVIPYDHYWTFDVHREHDNFLIMSNYGQHGVPVDLPPDIPIYPLNPDNTITGTLSLDFILTRDSGEFERGSIGNAIALTDTAFKMLFPQGYVAPTADYYSRSRKTRELPEEFFQPSE